MYVCMCCTLFQTPHKHHRQSAQNPENTFYSVKRLIGRDYEEVEDLVSKVWWVVWGVVTCCTIHWYMIHW